MLRRDSEDEMCSRFVLELVIWPQEVTLARWTQPSGPLCLWQCLYISKEKPPWKGPLPLKNHKNVHLHLETITRNLQTMVYTTPPLPPLSKRTMPKKAGHFSWIGFPLRKKLCLLSLSTHFQEGIDYDHVAIDVVDVKEDEVFHIGHRYEICFFHFFRMSHL